MKPTIAILITEPLYSQIIRPETEECLKKVGNLLTAPPDGKLDANLAAEMLSEADACMSSWGTPRFTEEVLANASKLKLIAHAAGSVKGLATEAVWQRGIRMTSGAAANAIDVAHYTISLMVLSLKNAFMLRDEARRGAWGHLAGREARELYGLTVGIIGASHVGREVIRLLQTGYDSRILLYDPYVSAQQSSDLGAIKVENLDELIRQSDVISIHAPNLPETKGMLNGENLPLMRDGAVLINTARGALLDEDALIQQLESGRIFACLDVTSPEPPAEDSPLRTLPNVFLTPHLAGSVSTGRARIGKYAAREIENILTGKPLVYEVTEAMLSKIA